MKNIGIIGTVAAVALTLIGGYGTVMFWAGDLSGVNDEIEANRNAIADNREGIDEIQEDLGEIRKDVGVNQVRLEANGDKIEANGNEIIEIRTMLWDMATTNQNSVVEKSSPIRLNEYGKKLFDLVDGEQIVKNHLDKVPVTEDMNNYEIQEACNRFAFRTLMDELSDDEKDVVQSVAYNEGINVDAILRVFSIRFRDEILKTRDQE